MHLGIQTTPNTLNATNIRLKWIIFIKFEKWVYALGLAFDVEVVKNSRKPQLDNHNANKNSTSGLAQ
jgi:hypothetical protein